VENPDKIRGNPARALEARPFGFARGT